MEITERQLRALILAEAAVNEGLFDFEDSQVLKALGLAPKKQKQIATSQDTPPVSANEEGRLKVIEQGLDINSKIHDIVYDHCYSANVIIGTQAGIDIRFRDKAAKFGSTELTDDDLKELRIAKIDELTEEYFKDFDLDGDDQIADIGDYEIALLSELKANFDAVKSDIRQEIKKQIQKGFSYYTRFNYDGPIEDFLLSHFDTDPAPPSRRIPLLKNGQYSFENDTIVFRNSVGIIVPNDGSDAFYNQDTVNSWASDPLVIKNQTENDPYFYSIVGVMIEIAFDDIPFEEDYAFDDEAYEAAYFAEIERQERVAKAKGQDPRLINTRKIAQKVRSVYKPALDIRSNNKKLPYAFKDFRYNVFFIPADDADMTEIDRDLGGMDNVYNKTFLAWEQYKQNRTTSLTRGQETLANQAAVAAVEKKEQEEQDRLRAVGFMDPNLKAQVPPKEEERTPSQSVTGKTTPSDIPTIQTPSAEKPVEKSVGKKIMDAIPFKRTDYLLTDEEIEAKKELARKEAEKEEFERKLIANTGTFFRNKNKINDDEFRKSMHEAIREIVRGQFARAEHDLVENLTILKKFYGPKSYISFPKSLISSPSGDQKLSIINLSEQDYTNLRTAASILTTYLNLLQEEILDEFSTNFFKHPDGEITYEILFNVDRTKLIKNALLPEYVPFTLLRSLDSTLKSAVNDQFAKLCEKVYNIPDFHEKKGNDTTTFQEQIQNLKNLFSDFHDIRQDQTFIRQRQKAAKRDQRFRADLETSVDKLKGDIETQFNSLFQDIHINADDATSQQLSDSIDAIIINIDKIKHAYADRAVRDKMKQMRSAIRGRGRKQKYSGYKDQITHILKLSKEILTMSAALDPNQVMVVKENFRLTSSEIREIIRSSLTELL